MSWTCDNSGNAVADGATVRHGGAYGPPEKKGNVMWEFLGGLGYWEFQVLGNCWGGFSLGVTTEANFDPSYGMKGLFFGGSGDLSDGVSLVQRGWGPKLNQGDVVGMRLEQQGDNTMLAFSRNGKGLGLAFNIQGWGEGTFVPGVSLDRPGQGVTIRQGIVPHLKSMNPSQGPRSGIEGAWKMDRAGVEDHTLEISKEESSWIVLCKVENLIKCQLEEYGPELKVENIVWREEGEMAQILEGITRLNEEGGKLIMTSGGKTINFNPVFVEKRPATKDQVNWMNGRTFRF